MSELDGRLIQPNMAIKIAAAWRQARKLLVVRLDNLGDVLLCTPAIHAIRETVPEARITLLASPVGAQVAELNPDIDDVLVYEAPWMDVWQRMPQDTVGEQEMIARLRVEAFDGAVIFTSFRQSSLPAAYLCYLAGIPLRAAISVDGAGSLLTTRHRPPEQPIVHEVRRHLDLVGAIGFRTTQDELVLKIDEAVRGAVCERLRREVPGTGPLVVLHPGCSMPARTYPWERFAVAADALIERLGCRVVFTGSADEVALVERIQTAMKHDSRRWAGRASFRELAGLISLADVVVTNNTGPQHMAAALHTPVVVLFALTNPPKQWGPWRVPHRLLYRDVPCALCYSRVCPTDHACLLSVTPDDVVAAAAELVAEGHDVAVYCDEAAA